MTESEKTKLAELILSVFKGREDHVAVGTADNKFGPHKLDHALPPEWLAVRHLSEVQCLGFYLMREDNRVYCSCVDFDNKPEKPDDKWMEKTETVYRHLCNLGLSPLVEVSASGNAAHVWLTFNEPTDAWVVRSFWRALSTSIDVQFVEVYPRQDQLTGKGIGNLVRYPLWNKSYFPDVESEEWDAIDPVEALTTVRRCDGHDLKVIALEMGAGDLKPESVLVFDSTGSSISVRVQQKLSRPHSLLTKRWNGSMEGMNDESRSALAQSIACELVRTYTPTAEVEQALRHWCNEHGYEKGKRSDWVSRTVAKAYDFVNSRIESRSHETTTMKDAVEAYIATLTSDMPRHVRTGISELDDSFDGMAFGEMIVIAARPGHGKSAFGLHWLDSAARDGLIGLIVSEEMSKLELGKRALLSISSLEESKWGVGTVNMLRHQAGDHFERRSEIHVVESCATIDRCEEVIDQHCAIYGAKVVAVDYLQLLTGRGQSRYEDVSEISRRLKQAARRNDCALLAMCQLNREIDKRDGHEPRLSDLRESGQIEQDADLILFLQWACRADANELDPMLYKVVCAKRRNGPIRKERMTIAFDANRQKFGCVGMGVNDPQIPDFNQPFL